MVQLPSKKIVRLTIFLLVLALAQSAMAEDMSRIYEPVSPIEFPAIEKDESSVATQVVSIKRSYISYGYFIFIFFFGIGAWIFSSSKKVKDDEVAIVNSFGKITKATGNQWVWGVWPMRKIQLVDTRPKGQIFVWSLNGFSDRNSVDLQAFVAFRNTGECALSEFAIEKLIYKNLSIILRNSYVLDLEKSMDNELLALGLIDKFNEINDKLIAVANDALAHFGIEIINFNLTVYDRDQPSSKSSANRDDLRGGKAGRHEVAASSTTRSSHRGPHKFRKVSYKQRYLI